MVPMMTFCAGRRSFQCPLSWGIQPQAIVPDTLISGSGMWVLFHSSTSMVKSAGENTSSGRGGITNTVKGKPLLTLIMAFAKWLPTAQLPPGTFLTGWHAPEAGAIWLLPKVPLLFL